MKNKEIKTVSPESIIYQALEVISSYCDHYHKGCQACMMHYNKSGCLIENYFPERFERWKSEWLGRNPKNERFINESHGIGD